MAVEVKVKTPTRYFSIILAITFGLVEEIVRKYCKSNGTKELTKGYKYFREKNVTDIKECTGYFGKFCNESCPPGRFGYRCGGSCSPECTVEYCNPVNGCNIRTKNTTHLTVSDTSTKNQVSSKETHLQKSELNITYLLAGAGAVIFVLLVIIVIQICKSAKKKSSLQHKGDENQTCDETFNGPPNALSKKYFSIISSKQSNHDYQHMDPMYHEIDESLELMPISASTDTTSKFGDHNLPDCINNQNNVTESDYLNAQTSKSYVLPNTCPDTEKTDYYQPVVILANIEIESKQETHSYIDVT